MKIRNGFVSNSSSSSFVIVASAGDSNVIDTIKKFLKNNDILVVSGKDGQHDFGWQNERYNDFWSKLNFAYLQAKYVETDPKYSYEVKVHPEWIVMLEKVLKDTLGVREIEWNITVEYHHGEEGPLYGYIDHQSASYEGQNTEIFESERALISFLFNEESYIQCGNDNE